MNQSMRVNICDRLIFQNPSQRTDLIDPQETCDELLECLHNIVVVHGWALEITAVRSDHHDDSSLGIYCHQYGRAIDCWPLYKREPGAYMDANSSGFASFLRIVAGAPWIKQIGLGGSAGTILNRRACGAGLYFPDNGADHVHIGASKVIV